MFQSRIACAVVSLAKPVSAGENMITLEGPIHSHCIREQRSALMISPDNSAIISSSKHTTLKKNVYKHTAKKHMQHCQNENTHPMGEI